MKTLICRALFALSLIVLNSSNAHAFDIVSVGELHLESDQITKEGVVNEYFGMNVIGLGESIIQVRVGNQSVKKSYEFKVSATQLYSYLFSYNLAEDISVDFRRGVWGPVSIDILYPDGSVADTTTFILDVTLPARNCRKYKSSRLKKCTRINTETATARQRLKLATVFSKYIKGPIVLEP